MAEQSYVRNGKAYSEMNEQELAYTYHHQISNEHPEAHVNATLLLSSYTGLSCPHGDMVRYTASGMVDHLEDNHGLRKSDAESTVRTLLASDTSPWKCRWTSVPGVGPVCDGVYLCSPKEVTDHYRAHAIHEMNYTMNRTAASGATSCTHGDDIPAQPSNPQVGGTHPDDDVEMVEARAEPAQDGVPEAVLLDDMDIGELATKYAKHHTDALQIGSSKAHLSTFLPSNIERLASIHRGTLRLSCPYTSGGSSAVPECTWQTRWGQKEMIVHLKERHGVTETEARTLVEALLNSECSPWICGWITPTGYRCPVRTRDQPSITRHMQGHANEEMWEAEDNAGHVHCARCCAVIKVKGDVNRLTRHMEGARCEQMKRLV